MARKLSVGRPPKAEADQLALVPIRFPPAMLAEIDAITESRMDRPGRSSVIRELVAEAIAARANSGGLPKQSTPASPIGARPHFEALIRRTAVPEPSSPKKPPFKPRLKSK